MSELFLIGSISKIGRTIVSMSFMLREFECLFIRHMGDIVLIIGRIKCDLFTCTFVRQGFDEGLKILH